MAMRSYQIISACSLLEPDCISQTYLHKLMQEVSIFVLRTKRSSISRLSSSCAAVRSSHPNSLIIRMTFITASYDRLVRYGRGHGGTMEKLTFSDSLYT